jgi:Sigma 54 modulation protein / S30EA ribosomal protein
MPVPLQLTARDVSLSQAAEEEIRAKAVDLETYDGRLTGCRVVVEGPGRHHRQAPYRVRIDLSVPGAELVVDRQADADLPVAIRDAFDAAPCRKTECGEAGLTYDGITAGCPAHHVGGVLIAVLTRQLGRRVLWRVNVIGGEPYPSHPCVFVRQRRHGAIGAAAWHERSEPRTSPVVLESNPAHGGSCPMDEHLAEVEIPPFADPESRGLASRGVLAWYKSQPRRALPAILEGRQIAHRHDQGRRGEWPHARNGQEALADWMGLTDGFQLLVVRRGAAPEHASPPGAARSLPDSARSASPALACPATRDETARFPWGGQSHPH